MADSSAKYKEGMQYLFEAEKALKTGFFKWREDFDTAADRYGKAALCFKLAGSLDRSLAAYVKSSEAHVSNRCLYHGAQNLTKAASIAVELENIEEAVSLMERAARLFRENGTLDGAAATYVKASKISEATLPDTAIELLEKAAELCELDEKYRDASKHLNSAVRIQLKNQKYFEACEMLSKFIALNNQFENFTQSYRAVLTMVIIQLTVDDSVAADRTVKEAFNYEGFVNSEEAETCEKMISAFEDGDEEELKRISRTAMVSMLDVEVAKLGRALKPSELSGGNAIPAAATVELSSADKALKTEEEASVKPEECASGDGKDDSDSEIDLC